MECSWATLRLFRQRYRTVPRSAGEVTGRSPKPEDQGFPGWPSPRNFEPRPRRHGSCSTSRAMRNSTLSSRGLQALGRWPLERLYPLAGFGLALGTLAGLTAFGDPARRWEIALFLSSLTVLLVSLGRWLGRREDRLF